MYPCSDSRSTLEDSYSQDQKTPAKDPIAQITQNFRPVTLTVNVFFKQVSRGTMAATRAKA